MCLLLFRNFLPIVLSKILNFSNRISESVRFLEVFTSYAKDCNKVTNDLRGKIVFSCFKASNLEECISPKMNFSMNFMGIRVQFLFVEFKVVAKRGRCINVEILVDFESMATLTFFFITL